MKEFFVTFSFLLRQNLSFKHFFSTLKENKRQRNMFIIASIIILMSAPSLGAFIFLYAKLYDILAQIGYQSFFIVIAILFSTVVIFFVAMFQIISYFYLSNEVKILIPLPIKTKHILYSKFFIIYIWELIINTFTVLPFFIIYGIKSQVDLLAWINIFASYILLPIIPLSVIGILVVFIMKFTNIFKNKDTFRMIGMTLILVLVIGGQLYFQSLAMSAPEGQEEEFYRNLFTNNQYLLERVVKFYPIITLVINTIIGSMYLRVSSIILFIVISIASVYIFGLILQSVYLNTYLSEQEQVNRNNKPVNLNQQRTSSVMWSIMSVDMKTLFRVPIYALNCLSTVIIIPVILIFTTVGVSKTDQLNTLYEPNKYLFWLIVALAICVIGPMNMITSTTFSREGKTNWIMRTLPIRAKDHIQGRLLSAIIVQAAFAFVSIVLVLFIIKQDYLVGTVIILLSIIASLPLHLLGLYIDLKRPVLKWDNPQVAVKQNLNVLIMMGLMMIYGLLAYLIFAGLKTIFTSINSISFMIIYLIFMVITILLSNLIYKKLHKQFEESLMVME